MIASNLDNLKLIENSILKKISRFGQFFLIIIIGSVLSMMMFPLPAALLDFLLAINIVGAVTILLVSISIHNSMKIATFPTILLVATLFRLGLNVASTRLILNEGYAGHIIQTFGEFVTGGNLLVGAIVFIILMIVQFVVIAKGSERVAEVAARFTLDALPGKQMSIDADLRAGIITQEDAKNQREALHRESKLYGSMDGAMKFVKGDAIAGLIITAVNIFGGLFTGLTQKGMSLSQAGSTYSILTIGDGLVSQIPALLISITAGFVVTRVVDEKNSNSLGADMGIQLLSQPKALLVASFLALLIGFLPGFPLMVFTLLSLTLAGTSFYLMWIIKKKASEPIPVQNYIIDTEQQILSRIGQAIPLALEVGPELYKIFQEDPRWTHCFGILYSKLKLHLSNQLGVIFPDLKLSVNNSLSQSFRYQIRIYEVPVDFGFLSPRHCAFLGERSGLKNLDLEEPANSTETVHGTKMTLWNLNKKESLARLGISTYGPEEMILRHFARVLKKHSGDFIGIQEVRDLLNHVEDIFPELVREVVPKVMSIQKLTEVVKRLVEEGVPIKDFRLILQTLSCSQPESKDPVTLTEQVRIGLKRLITFMHTHNGNHLSVFTINQEIEDEIRKAIQQNGQECYLALPPERMQVIVQAFKDNCIMVQNSASKPVILTHLDIRRYVRKIIDEELPDMSVLSFQELDPKVLIEQVGTVTFEKNLEAVVA